MATNASKILATDEKTQNALLIPPLVVCGPSGVGKGTLLGRLMTEYPSSFSKSVSHTTRAPRPGEISGVSYHFTTKADFESSIERGEFIEYATVHGNIYGTSVQAVEHVSKSGRVCILEIDVQGAELIRKTGLKPFYIFISPPNVDELYTRLRGRGTESSDTIRVRLETAQKELEYFKSGAHFDFNLVNDDLEKSYGELKIKLTQLYPHLKNAKTVAIDPKVAKEKAHL